MNEILGTELHSVEEPKQYTEVRRSFSLAPAGSSIDESDEVEIDLVYGLGFEIQAIVVDPTQGTGYIDTPPSIAIKLNSDSVHEYQSWRQGGWYGGEISKVYIRNPYKAPCRIVCRWWIANIPGVKAPRTGYNPRPIEIADTLNLKNLGHWDQISTEIESIPVSSTIFDLSRSAGTLPANYRSMMDQGRPLHVLPTIGSALLYLWDTGSGAFVSPEEGAINLFCIKAHYQDPESGYLEETGTWDHQAGAGALEININFAYMRREYLVTGLHSGQYANIYQAEIPRGIVTKLDLLIPALNLQDAGYLKTQLYWEHCPVDPMLYGMRSAVLRPGRWG